MFTEALASQLDLKKFETDVKAIANEARFESKQLQKEICDSWAGAVEAAFDDGVLSEEEEQKLVDMKNQFGLSHDELNRDGAYERVVKGAVIREILDGHIPERRLQIAGAVPFNLQKSEKLIWLFPDTDYHEVKIKQERLGGSKGFSVGIAKGVYYRVGDFKSQTVERVETIDYGSGLLGVTHKHLYYSGEKTFRVRLDKIVSIEPYRDGISIQRDAATAKPQSFVTGDGWFTHNLVANAGNLQAL